LQQRIADPHDEAEEMANPAMDGNAALRAAYLVNTHIGLSPLASAVTT
jgi:hypothetical protein